MTIKDLTNLLTVTGLAVSGTKPVLKHRLVTYLSAILKRIESLGGSHHFVAAAATTTTATATPRFYQDQTLEQDQDFEINGSSSNISRTLEQIKLQVLPQSIVSIDIGIRKLAWVQVSRDGEILRWAVEDLLADDDNKGDDACANTGAEDDEVKGSDSADSNADTMADAISSSDSQKSSKQRLTSTKAKSKAYSPPPAFESRTVATRLDKVMRHIFNNSEYDGCSIEGVVMEQQRSRTGGMPAVLDSAFRCGIVEGMIQTWLAVWHYQLQQQQQQQQQQQRQGQEYGLGREQGPKQERHPIFIESISPRAVAAWWGIGAASMTKGGLRNTLSAASLIPDVAMSVTKPIPTSTSGTVSATVPDDLYVDPGSSIQDNIINVDLNDDGGDNNVDSGAAGSKSSEKPTYYAKKLKSRALVDHWILASPTQSLSRRSRHSRSSSIGSSNNNNNNNNNDDDVDIPFQLRCSPEIRAFYSQEKKRDDLSDALLQAVTWFEWRQRAIQEAIERFHVPTSVEPPAKKLAMKSMTSRRGLSRASPIDLTETATSSPSSLR
ncbi:hypothetical protein BGZ99_001005 [Dissophora globulifera]|uniref:SAP domain-containing protein n=1 Tax=Dissophora globulifera TaxID=979702 RepID=A0A9P6RQ36_9FUNG|nr:hypothetical protein BGZ99_001005 [Dissophora globulifera]